MSRLIDLLADLDDPYYIFVGKAVHIIPLVLLGLLLAYLLWCGIYHTFRYCRLFIRAENFHGDVFKDDYKKKRLWKFRFVVNTIRRKFFTLMLLTEGTRYSKAGKFYFTSSKAKVTGLDS